MLLFILTPRIMNLDFHCDKFRVNKNEKKESVRCMSVDWREEKPVGLVIKTNP